MRASRVSSPAGATDESGSGRRGPDDVRPLGPRPTRWGSVEVPEDADAARGSRASALPSAAEGS